MASLLDFHVRTTLQKYKMETHKFTVAMTCGGCSGAVTRILTKKLEEGSNFEVNLEDKLVVITSSKTSDELMEILKKCGKEVSYVGKR